MVHTPIKIDLSYLYSITAGDKVFEQLLLTGTVADVDSMITGLKGSWDGGDAVAIRKTAHSLVSLSAIAGMPQVEVWSRKLDQGFSDGVFHPELEPLALNIIYGWPEAKSQLEEVLATA
jgi:hypothetical protein